jgi:hypothetical protein
MTSRRSHKSNSAETERTTNPPRLALNDIASTAKSRNWPPIQCPRWFDHRAGLAVLLQFDFAGTRTRDIVYASIRAGDATGLFARLSSVPDASSFPNNFGQTFTTNRRERSSKKAVKSLLKGKDENCTPSKISLQHLSKETIAKSECGWMLFPLCHSKQFAVTINAVRSLNG